MTKKTLIISNCIVLCSLAMVSYTNAQYNNDWINYAQTYFKIPVAENGVYEINYNQLQQAGFPVDVVDPRSLQLFHRGVEQSIEVTGQGDARFHNADVIRFYGKANDGTLDRFLYNKPSHQPHKYYNLYSDTTAYFLTWTLDTSKGKRIESYFENNVTNIAKEQYVNTDHLALFTEQYGTGYVRGKYIQRTAFDIGEGWVGFYIRKGHHKDYTLSGLRKNKDLGSNPTIEIQIMGRNEKPHEVQLFVGASSSSLRSLGKFRFDNFNSYIHKQTINWSDISSDGKLVVRASSLGVSKSNDLVSLNYAKITYPTALDFNHVTNRPITILTNPNGKSYLEIVNSNAKISIWDITSTNAPQRIGYSLTANIAKAIVSKTATQRELLVTDEYKKPLKIKKLQLTAHIPKNYNYLIISHKALMKSAGSYPNVVQAYADYRKSPSGGSHKPIVLDIDDLYDHFSFGERTPLAIFQALKYYFDKGKPKNLFIIGKGNLVYSYKRHIGRFVYYRKQPHLFKVKDYIPTAGAPGSDLTYSVGLQVKGEIAIPTGRITAYTPEQVANYLDKVKTHESFPFDDLWRKRILHLSGGKTAIEQARFKKYMEAYQAIAESEHLGGKVTSLKKQTSKVNEFINVTDQINSGLGLITFFGHSAPNITDIDIGFVSDPLLNYNKTNKYPFILVNGCNAGEIYSNVYQWGEDWVFTPDKGAVGFIAHSSFGYESALDTYTTKFYKYAFANPNYINKSVGEIMQLTVKDYLSGRTYDADTESITQQMILEGDPAISIFGNNKADYATFDNRPYFVTDDGNPINVFSKSFRIAIPVDNYGAYKDEPLNVRITRRLANNSEVVYDNIFRTIPHQDTLYVRIPNNIAGIAGRNVFEIQLDYVNVIPEINENNNTAVIELTLLSNGTKNLLPIDFAMINTTKYALIAQVEDLTSIDVNRKIDFEIDTLRSFDSSFKKSKQIKSNGIASWTADLLSTDSMTYYWRTRLATPKEGESKQWHTSSFTYIKNGTHGWMQQHRQQFSKNQFKGLAHDEKNDKFSFEQIKTDISVTTYGSTYPDGDWKNSLKNSRKVKLVINGQNYIYPQRYCWNNTLNIVAFNKQSTTPYPPIFYKFSDRRTCGRTDQVINSFYYTDIKGAKRFLKKAVDAVADGDYVLIFTIGDVGFTGWDASILSQIERLGGSSAVVSALKKGDPFIMLGHKGSAPNSAIHVTAKTLPANRQKISLKTSINGVKAQGTMLSTLIGNTSQWQQFYQKVRSSENDYSTKIIGIEPNSNQKIFADTPARSYNLSNVDSKKYTSLRLAYTLNDPKQLTPAQLDHWVVTFEEIPEGVLLNDNKKEKIKVQEGKKVPLYFKYVNISSIHYASTLTAHLTIKNRTSGKVNSYKMSIPSPSPNDTTHFSFKIPTLGMIGQNDIIIKVLPDNNLEQYLENNNLILEKYLEIIQDTAHPLIDVVFDGVHIENGDVVSPTTTIDIAVIDDNSTLLITDTTMVDVYLSRSCKSCTYQRLTYASDSVKWTVATASEPFHISYQPAYLKDSLYHLRIVAKDASNNRVPTPYELSFTTDKVASIRYKDPYPNPTTGKVNFDMKITGESPPKKLTVEILDTHGKSILQFATTSLRIGRNKFVIDLGKNDQGTNPQGLYLYRLTTKGGNFPIKRGKIVLYR